MLKTTQIYFCLFFLLLGSITFSKDIYVATDGNDASGDGTINNPYRTFEKAISEMSAGDVCIIREGVYNESLIINKNGSVGNYLKFKAADGEKVNIRATSKINDWQLHSGNIYKANVNMSIDGRFRAVYHNGEYMDLARWPNNTDNNRWTVDCSPATGGDAGTSITGDGIPDYDWEDGGLIYYLGAHSGTSWTRAITASTTSSISHTEVDINKWPFSVHNVSVWRNYPGNNRGQFFLFNKLEALDHAREWFYDSGTSTLYLQTADGNMPADGAVEYAKHKYAAQISGEYIILNGLNFFGGSVKVDNNADNNQILNCKIIHGSEGHDDLNNTSAQVGEATLQVLGDNTLIKGCTIDHSSVSGIVIAGWAASNCTIEGNSISNMDYLGIHASPIRTSGDNVKVLENTITNAGRDGMYVAGSNCEIAYNDVSNSQKINSDSGVFYTVGNASLKNNKIHHNWFHDATAPSYSHNPNDPGKAAGIYLDNNSKGYTVHHNVVWNVSWSGYQVNWNNTNLDFFHNTIWNTERAMDSWVNGYPQENNKIYNNYSNKGDWHTGNGPQEFDIQNNIIANTTPFEDPANMNFMPKSGSELIDAASIISGFNKPFQGSAPDIGAYEKFGTRWTAGVNAIKDTGEGQPISILDTQFTISATTETCPNKDNGTINIVADVAQDYSVNINGTDQNFTNQLNLENLKPDVYELCISINDNPESQCFSIEIKEATQLFSNSSLTNKKYSINIQEGTAPFVISVNDKVIYETYEQSLAVNVNQGDEVKIKSSKDCEGEIIEIIDMYDSIISYPNPTNGDFQLQLPVNEGKISIELYDIYSRLISSKVYVIESGKVNLSLHNEPSGMYFARILGENPVYVKVIKK
ncbi:Por secretion system C-terminal sorting domain-containing protein [Salegentibacter agarivorans]|uniref:Por secretion system C-terminal sorting domain-containing protein n=1 Tax=Salegentibacter agarivorans TaxID=345907 RepID=A0A1I2KPD4_9FLAO|nr:T9SS type A sorting domain-containing protein [Salegentibacter agarivorans]SFF68189.1 Por secretion system C-terminal sorting domain-containing protein [Salegentibacter agarivorans]